MTATVASPVVSVTQAAEDDFLDYVEGGEIFVNNVPEFGQESTDIFKDTVSLNKEVFTRYTFTLTQPSYVQIGYEQYNSTSSWGVSMNVQLRGASGSSFAVVSNLNGLGYNSKITSCNLDAGIYTL